MVYNPQKRREEYLRHREARLERGRKWKEENKARIKQVNHEWYERNSSKVLAKRHIYVKKAETLAIIRETSRKYRESHPGWASEVSSAGSRLRQLETPPTMKHRSLWTREEEDFIVKNHELMSDVEMANRLGRTYYAYRTHLGLMQRRGAYPMKGRIPKKPHNIDSK